MGQQFDSNRNPIGSLGKLKYSEGIRSRLRGGGRSNKRINKIVVEII